jgi:hypothetical protein
VGGGKEEDVIYPELTRAVSARPPPCHLNAGSENAGEWVNGRERGAQIPLDNEPFASSHTPTPASLLQLPSAALHTCTNSVQYSFRGVIPKPPVLQMGKTRMFGPLYGIACPLTVEEQGSTAHERRFDGRFAFGLNIRSGYCQVIPSLLTRKVQPVEQPLSNKSDGNSTLGFGFLGRERRLKGISPSWRVPGPRSSIPRSTSGTTPERDGSWKVLANPDNA